MLQALEIFVFIEFFKLCKQTLDLIEADKVRDFWCYCTLTIGDQKDLYELVDLFDKTITDKEKHKFWILVSYDTTGRFHIPERKDFSVTKISLAVEEINKLKFKGDN